MELALTSMHLRKDALDATNRQLERCLQTTLYDILSIRRCLFMREPCNKCIRPQLRAAAFREKLTEPC